MATTKTLELKLVDEKGTTKTYIGGLSNFVEGSEIKDLTKKMQELLDKKMSKRKVENEIECGFDGNNIDSLKTFFLTNITITEDSISIVNEAENEKDNKKESNPLDKINKKISLYYVKEKRASRTYIIGLKTFLKGDELQNLSKKLQKILGTNSIFNDDGECGFNGDYTSDTAKKTIIKNFILENTQISGDLIEF